MRDAEAASYPAIRAERSALRAERQEQQPTMVARILLIDGDDETRQRSAAFLRSVGFHVVDVPDAHGATERARASSVNIVVSEGLEVRGCTRPSAKLARVYVGEAV